MSFRNYPIIIETKVSDIISFFFIILIEIQRDAEEQAEKIAHEIESQPAYKERTDIENGDENEEAKFAAVERPQSDSPDEIKAGKYVAPGRRKQHNTQAGKLIRPSQLNVNSNNASSSASSASSTSSTSSVPSSQPSCNNKFSLPQHSLPQQSTQKNTGVYNLFLSECIKFEK